ncbi:MAG: hypothetical protein GDA68_23175 [Nitrospira sp. CR2.1]|nr:hypothetical protein [Nitrospira sp. CR2.1]
MAQQQQLLPNWRGLLSNPVVSHLDWKQACASTQLDTWGCEWDAPLQPVEGALEVMMSSEMAEALAVIRNFIEDKEEPWEWDDFLSVPPKDPDVVRLQGFCRQLTHDYPPEHENQYCSSTGMERLRTLLEELTPSEGSLANINDR